MMKRAHILPLLALAVPFLALAAAGPAHAGTPPAESRQAIVAYADLDLTRAGDGATLYQRMDGAARKICRSLNLGKTVEHRRAYDTCWAGAMTRAAANTGNAQVAELVQGIVDPAGRSGTKRQFADRDAN
jgi:UrcA family protein